MPTINSEYYDNQVNELVRYRSASNISNGEVRIATFEYKFGWKSGETAAASGDIIKLGRLDPGITVLADRMQVLTEGSVSAATLTAIGDQQVANRYTTTAVTLTAVAFVSVTPVAATTIPEVVITKDINDILQATLGGTLPATVGKRFWVRVWYRMPS